MPENILRKGVQRTQSFVNHLVDVYKTQPEIRPLYWGVGIGLGGLTTSLACLGVTTTITEAAPTLAPAPIPTAFPGSFETPVIANPSTLTQADFNRLISQDWQQGLASSNDKYLNEVNSVLPTGFKSQVDTITHWDQVFDIGNNEVAVKPASVLFNSELLNEKNEKASYLVEDSLFQMKLKDGQLHWFAFSSFTDESGKQTRTVHEVMFLQDGSDLVIATKSDNETTRYGLFGFKDVLDENGNIVKNGKAFGFNYVTGEKISPITPANKFIGTIDMSSKLDGSNLSNAGTISDGSGEIHPLMGTKVLASLKPVVFNQNAPTATPAGPTVTETPIPPAPTEAAPVLQLDKPMTDNYRPFNFEYMPSISENQAQDVVDKGVLANTVDVSWKTHSELGVYDANGNVILPPGVQPVQPDQWKIDNIEGPIVLNWGHSKDLDPANAAFQKSNEQFAIKSQDGKVIAVLVTEKLYYYDDQGKLHVIPVFSRFDADHLYGTTLPDGSKGSDMVTFTNAFLDYGHKLPGGSGPNPSIAIPVLNKEPSYKGGNGLVDYSSLFAPGPMQDKRNAIIASVQGGNFDPKDLSKVWVAGQSMELASQILNP